MLSFFNSKKMEQTLGQIRTKAEFNPAKSDIVDQIKNKASELIDLIETLRAEGSPERSRVIAVAQTSVETACMYGVKANFTK
jgi:hypothetical protein